MKLVLLLMGKSDRSWLREGIDEYVRRISRYASFEIITLPEVRNSGGRPQEWVMAREAERLLAAVRSDDHLVLLDERGRGYTTLGLAEWLRGVMLLPVKRVVFVVGGPYGFGPSVRERGDTTLSLSLLTFPHQLVRLLFAEQLYRVLSVNAGSPYHHE